MEGGTVRDSQTGEFRGERPVYPGTEINDIRLSCHCASGRVKEKDDLRPHWIRFIEQAPLACKSTPCTDQICQNGGSAREWSWWRPYDALTVGTRGKCDRMGIYICDAAGFQLGKEEPSTALERINKARQHGADGGNRTTPILVAGLDEIAQEALHTRRYENESGGGRRDLARGRSVAHADKLFLSDIMAWIQHNLTVIIREYTRESRRLWDEFNDNREITRMIKKQEIKYALVVETCRVPGDIYGDYAAGRRRPWQHHWTQNPRLPAGDSSENLLAPPAPAPPAPKTILAKFAEGIQKQLGGDWEDAGRGHFGGRRKNNQRKKTNRLRRVRRRHKKTKRRRRQRKTRRRT